MSERQPRNPEAGTGGPAGSRPGGPIGGQPGQPGGPSSPRSGAPIGGQPGGSAGNRPGGAGDADTGTGLLTGNRLRIVAILGIAIFLAVLGLVGYFAWMNIAYVDTLHARVDGSIVQVRAPAAGRVADFPLEVGDAVGQHEELLVLESAGAAGTSPVSRLLVPVTAPMAGVLTDKAAKVGDIVQAGQILATLVDPNDLWVTASVHESRVPQIRVGQNARIDINTRTVRHTFWGRVEQISRATNTALAASRGVDTSTPRPAEVAVRISIDAAGYDLYPGMTTQVRVRLSPR